MIKNNKYNQGFSLIELSIVLLIISSLIAMISFSIEARINASKFYVTKERMQMIMNALDNYVEIYGHLPCPAARVEKTDPSYGWNEADEDMGEPYCPGVVEVYTEPCVPYACGFTLMGSIGDVPFKVLGLDPQTMVDGWGVRFDYAVGRKAVLTSDFASSTEVPFGIQNEGAYVDTSLFVLVSHGPNMHGGYLDKTNTQVTISSPTTADEENSDNANSFVVAAPSLNNDDIVLYKKKSQLPKYMNQ